MDKEYLKLACKAVEKHLPDNHGFILLTFPFGVEGRVAYSSNGDRKDCIAMMKEFLIRTGNEEEWMKHIN